MRCMSALHGSGTTDKGDFAAQSEHTSDCIPIVIYFSRTTTKKLDQKNGTPLHFSSRKIGRQAIVNKYFADGGWYTARVLSQEKHNSFQKHSARPPLQAFAPSQTTQSSLNGGT